MGSYDELLMSHLKKNADKWDALVKGGHRETDKVRIQFLYYCENYDNGELLRAFFVTDTDFEVELTKRNDFWSLAGNTLNTVLTLELLNSWVKWMIDSGLRFQCVFDSWDFVEAE